VGSEKNGLTRKKPKNNERFVQQSSSSSSWRIIVSQSINEVKILEDLLMFDLVELFFCEVHTQTQNLLDFLGR
jgi:hypothetical protein